MDKSKIVIVCTKMNLMKMNIRILTKTNRKFKQMKNKLAALLSHITKYLIIVSTKRALQAKRYWCNVIMWTFEGKQTLFQQMTKCSISFLIVFTTVSTNIEAI